MKQNFFYILLFCCLQTSLWAQTTPIQVQSGGGAALRLGAGGTNTAASTTIEPEEFTGSATYSFDIPTPPARGGVQPTLTLNYNSMRRNPNSWVGYGWELDIGSIIRTSGANGVIDYLRGTSFEMRRGGQSESLKFIRILSEASSYGISVPSGQVADLYQAQTESSFSWFIHIHGSSENSDSGWIVLDKSGIRYEFGGNGTTQERPPFTTDDASVRSREEESRIFRWFLEQVVDSNNNVMTVEYDLVNKFPERIIYQDIQIRFVKGQVGSTSSTDFNAAFFPTFRDGSPPLDVSHQVLNAIEIHQGSALLQRHVFSYTSSSQRRVRQLASIQQFGSDGSSLPPITFSYFGEETSFSPGYFSRQASRSERISGLINDSTTFADMNGDGLADQVVANEDGSFEVYFNNGNDFVHRGSALSHWGDRFPRCGGSLAGDPDCRGRLNSFREGHQWLFLMDMNGDGLPDRVTRALDRDVGSSNEHGYFRIAFNNGHGWDSPVDWEDPYEGQWTGTSDQHRGLIDMNGDGLPDRVVSDQTSDSVVVERWRRRLGIRDGHDGGFFVFYNNGAGFSEPPDYWKDPLTNYSDDHSDRGLIFASDGDDVRVSIRDMNGDGLPDRIVRVELFEASRSVGFGFGVQVNLGYAWAQAVRHPTISGRVSVNGYTTFAVLDRVSDENKRGILDKQHDLIDVNGDGFLDRVEGNHERCELKFYFFQGMTRQRGEVFSQLSPPVTFTDPVVDSPIRRGEGSVEKCGYVTNRTDGENPEQFVFFQDITGDGLPDRFSTAAGTGDSYYVGKSLQLNPLLYRNPDRPEVQWSVNQPMDALKEVRDGKGGATAIEYRPSTWVPEGGFPDHRFLPFNLNIVHKVYAEDPTFTAPFGFSAESGRHPNMRWTTYLFRGGNYFIRHASLDGSRSHFARFNGFQEVTKIPMRSEGETWSPYKTITRYHQARGDVGPSSSDFPGADGGGYTHFALSGKPYQQIVKEGDSEVVRQEMTWNVVHGLTDNFSCGPGPEDLCYPQQTSIRKTVDADGGSRVSRVDYAYDSFGNITSESHFDGRGSPLFSLSTQYTPASVFSSHRILDRPSQQTKSGPTGAVLRRKTFTYDTRGNPERETLFVTADGSRTLSVTRHFNAQGNMDSITDADGVTKTIGYDTDGLFPTTETVTTPGGSSLTTTRAFDRLTGEVAEERGPQGVGKRIVRDGFGRPIEEYILSSRGAPTFVRQNTYAYESLDVDGSSQIVLHTTTTEPQPDFPTTPLVSESYSLSGLVLQKCTQSERGNYRLIQYRVYNGGREEIQTEPVFSDNCYFISSLNPILRVYRKQKDLMGRDTLVQPPPGEGDSPVGNVQISYATNTSGQLVKTIINPRGQTTVETYDAQERLIDIKDPAGVSTQYAYNAVGDLLSVTGAGRTLTTISYDLLGRKTDMTDADMGYWQYRYDPQGRLEKQIDARRQYTKFIYDSLGRIDRKENHLADDTLEKQEIYSYDTGSDGYDIRPGELFQITEKDGSGSILRRTRFDYDADYRRTRRLSRQIPGVGEFHQTLNHDYLGRVRDTTYPGGRQLVYNYMRNGNLMKVCDGSCTSGEIYYQLEPTSAFDVFGNLHSESYGNGVTGEYSYYPNSHRLQNKRVFRGTNTYLQRNYTYDENANLTQISDPLNLQGTAAIRTTSYDNLDRLTGYTYQNGGSSSLTYDSRGNIVQNSESFGTNNYQYTSTRPHAVTQIGDQRFDYDTNGNMISDPNRRMFYNANNQLIRVEMQNGNVVHYDYDYTGARVSKRAVTRDLYRRTTTTTTHYLGDALEIKGDQITLNVYAGPRRVATRTIGTVSSLTGTAGGTLMNNGIDPELNLTLIMPYLFVFFVLFLLGSLRPWPSLTPTFILPRWWGGNPFFLPRWKGNFPPLPRETVEKWGSRKSPLPLWERARVRGSLLPAYQLLCNIYEFWLSWCSTFQQTLKHYPKHAFAKSFLLFMILLFQLQPMSLLFADEGEPRFPTSDADYFYYVHDDHLGSSALLTEGKPTGRHSGLIYNRGDLLQRFEYAPFGKETFVLNPNLQFDPSYTGQKYDVETGLYYYKTRYYNPILGRFIQPDTVVPDAKNLQAYNRYTYVNNNPLKYVDPSGHFWGLFGKIFAALVGTFLAVVTGFALTPLIGAFWAGVIAGAVGGLVSGAITGGLKGALLGAAFGALGGAAFGGANIGLEKLGMTNQWGRFAVMSGVGAAISGGTGGWQGLVVFGAGLAGVAAGYGVGKPIGAKIAEWKANRDYQLKLTPEKPHFDFGRPSIGQRMQAQLGPDTSEPLAWGVGGDVTAGGGGGIFAGERVSASGGYVYDGGSGVFYSVGTTEAGSAQFSLGGSVGAGGEITFYTGNIAQFSGSANTLNVTLGQFSFSVTQGSNGGAFFTIGHPMNPGGGFEFSVIQSHTIIKPIDIFGR